MLPSTKARWPSWSAPMVGTTAPFCASARQSAVPSASLECYEHLLGHRIVRKMS